MRTLLISAALLAGLSTASPQAQAQPGNAAAWEIGPVIRGRNHSVGTPYAPTQGPRGWFVDFPYPHVGAGHVHYLTYNHGPLMGARRIVMRYRIDAAPGVRFVARDTPGEAATISLFLQRSGDDWSARGPYGGYRFYAPAHTVASLTPGEHVMTVNLDGGWTSVNGVAAARDPYAFREALAETEGVGIVLGSRSRRGHGVFATGPARLTVLSFQIM
jgi:hypothetical protein